MTNDERKHENCESEEKDLKKVVKGEPSIGDPHHPDHPRNQSKDKADKKTEEQSSDKTDLAHGGDPHHPDHPRNRF